MKIYFLLFLVYFYAYTLYISCIFNCTKTGNQAPTQNLDNGPASFRNCILNILSFNVYLHNLIGLCYILLLQQAYNLIHSIVSLHINLDLREHLLLVHDILHCLILGFLLMCLICPIL